jgi:hypothetical protein
VGINILEEHTASPFRVEDSMLIQNVGIDLPDYQVSQPWRKSSKRTAAATAAAAIISSSSSSSSSGSGGGSGGGSRIIIIIHIMSGNQHFLKFTCFLSPGSEMKTETEVLPPTNMVLTQQY